MWKLHLYDAKVVHLCISSRCMNLSEVNYYRMHRHSQTAHPQIRRATSLPSDPLQDQVSMCSRLLKLSVMYGRSWFIHSRNTSETGIKSPTECGNLISSTTYYDMVKCAAKLVICFSRAPSFGEPFLLNIVISHRSFSLDNTEAPAILCELRLTDWVPTTVVFTTQLSTYKPRSRESIAFSSNISSWCLQQLSRKFCRPFIFCSVL